MATLRALLERRAALKTELQSIHDAHPEGELPEEMATRWTELTAESGTLEQRIARQAQLDEIDRRVNGQPVTGGGAPRREVRAFAGVASEVPEGFDGATLRSQTGELVPVLEHRHRLSDFLPRTESRATELGLGGFMRALYRGAETELERRVMAEGAVGTGGALVPAPLASEVIDLLRARSAAFQAGVRTVPMTSATLKFARVTAYPVGSWRAENAPIAESQPALDTATLNAKSWALIVRCSRELIEDGQNTSDVIKSIIANAGALALDQAILFGSGTSNAPLGIANQPGVQEISMGTNGGTVAGWTKVLDAVTALEMANAGDVTGIVYSPRTARVVYGLQDSSGQPMEVPPRLRNIPILSTTSVPVDQVQGTATNASSILLGNFAEALCGIRSGLTISVLGERYADVGQVAFLVWLRADLIVARPAALAKITGIIPA